MDLWLDWDNKIFEQARGYYTEEAQKINDTYKEYYIITLAFKLIYSSKGEYYPIVKGKLLPLQNLDFDRSGIIL